MALDQSRPPSHLPYSSSNEDVGSVRSYPGRLNGDSVTPSPRRVRLPRSKSTSNMLDAAHSPLRTTRDQLRNIVLEQVDTENVRALAEFLRTTEPPSVSPISNDDCFGFTGSKVHKKFSSRSLRQGKKTEWPAESMQIQLPKSVVPETTTAGNRHIAITIPVPNYSRGPWSRSQYPVLTPGTNPRTVGSPKEWPERSSSRGAVVSKDVQDRVPRRGSSISSLPSFTEEGRRERSMSSLSMVRPATAKPALNPVEECHEYSGLQQGDGKVIPLAARDKQRRRSMSVNFGHRTLAFRDPSMDFEFPTTNSATERRESGSPVTPKSLRHRRQLSRMSKKSKESRDFSSHYSPRSPPRSPPEQPSDIVVKPTLAVPKASILPDSPGFPNMLATMSFPSPPTASRSSSRANSISSTSLDVSSLISPITPPMPSPSPTATPPTIQPRTTSKRACVTTTFSPTASLNEVVMRHARPSSQPTEPRDVLLKTDLPQLPIVPSSPPYLSKPDEKPKLQVEPFYENRSMKDNEVVKIPPEESTPIVDAKRRDSLESDGAGGSKSQRQSVSSNTTGTTDTYSQLAPTYNSFRSSARSDVTTSTFTTIRDGVWSQEPPSNRESQISIGSIPIMGVAKPEFTDSPTLGKDENIAEQLQLIIGRRGSTPRYSPSLSSPSSVSQDDEDLESTGIEERRLARKAKVHEYKQRDVNAQRVGIRTSMIGLAISQEASMDSPVLGWFPRESQRSRPQNPSPLTQTAPWSSSFNSSAGAASQRPQTRQGPTNPILKSTSPLAKVDAVQSEASNQPETQPRVWTFSPMMVSASISAELPLGNELTMSPMMEIASIDPNPEPNKPKSKRSSHRLSTLLLLESSTTFLPSSRTSVRPKLQSRPLSRMRPASIIMSRNPNTGAIERTITAPKATLSYNQALPTPPTSSEMSPRRWSFPVRALSTTPPSSTSWDRPPSFQEEPEEDLPEEEEDDMEDPEEEKRDSRSRSDIIKERLQQQKEEKEREISNIVARTVIPTPAPTNYEEASSPEQSPESNSVGEVERRLRRLQRNGDAWLQVMGPLLENMNKTLEAVQKGGIGGSSPKLSMSEFMIDMDAEARRSSMLSQSVPAIRQFAASQKKGSSKEPDNTKQLQSVSPSHGGSKERRRLGRGRSSSSLARLRMRLDGAAKKSMDLTSRQTEPEGFPRDESGAKGDLPLAQETTPRQSISPSSQDHDFEVEMAIRQRIKKQEAAFNELMNRWNNGSSPRSPRPSDHHRSASAKPYSANDNGHVNDKSDNGKPRVIDSGGSKTKTPIGTAFEEPSHMF